MNKLAPVFAFILLITTFCPAKGGLPLGTSWSDGFDFGRKQALLELKRFSPLRRADHARRIEYRIHPFKSQVSIKVPTLDLLGHKGFMAVLIQRRKVSQPSGTPGWELVRVELEETEDIIYSTR